MDDTIIVKGLDNYFYSDAIKGGWQRRSADGEESTDIV